MSEEFTLNLSLPLPVRDNQLRDDVQRIRDAMSIIDSTVASKADLVSGKVPVSQLPSYVDDVVEVANVAALPATGESGKIYITIDSTPVKSWRWTGTAYSQMQAAYDLPAATPTTLGGVKVGSGLTVGADGLLSTVGGGAGSGLPVYGDISLVPDTDGKTAFTISGGYTVGQLDVYLNGVLLNGGGDDYTASNGTSITLTRGANTTDSILVRRWVYLPEAQALAKNGDTMNGALNWAPAVVVASATTTNIGLAASNNVTITGTTAITSFGTYAAGAVRTVTFAGSLTLTHNALSLILPGGANIVTAAGDVASFMSLGSGNWRCIGYTSSKLFNVKTLEQFGVIGDGVADDTTAIQLALNSGNKRICGTPGATYKITNTILIDAEGIEIDLLGASILLDDATGLKDHIKIGNGTTRRNGIKLQNVVFKRSQTATAGFAINSDLIGVCSISGCRIYGENKIHAGIRVYRGIIVNIQSNYIDNCVDRGITLIGSGLADNRTVDIVIRENRVDGCTTSVESKDFVEGLFCRDNIFYNPSSHCVIVDASSNANGLMSFKFQENDFDTTGGSGLYIDKVNNIQVTGCWFSANSGDALVLKEMVDGAVVCGNQIYPIANGIFVYCLSSRISSNFISGGATSVKLASSASRADISGNTFSNAQYGVDLGSSAEIHLTSNSIYGMSNTAITGVAGTGSVIQGNKGDLTVGTSGFITVSASPFTYKAGARSEYVSIFGGTVSQIAINGNNIGFTTNRDVVLAPGQSVVVTYSSAPFMVRNFL